MADYRTNLLSKYISGEISARVMLSYLEDGDYYNSYYALKMLEAEVDLQKLLPSQRHKVFDIIIKNVQQSLCYLISHQIREIGTEEERNKALQVVTTDYCTLEKLMDNYFSLNYIKTEEIANAIKTFDRSKSLNNRVYDDLIIKTARAIKYAKLDNNDIIIDVCSTNIDLFDQCITYSAFDNNKRYAFHKSNHYFDNKARRSMQKCLDYCCYFDEFINQDHLEVLVRRIQGSKAFGIARDLINKKYTFPQFTQEQIDKLESLVIMKELQGGF